MTPLLTELDALRECIDRYKPGVGTIDRKKNPYLQSLGCNWYDEDRLERALRVAVNQMIYGSACEHMAIKGTLLEITAILKGTE